MGAENMITFSIPLICPLDILLHHNFHRLVTNLNDGNFAFLNIGKDTGLITLGF